MNFLYFNVVNSPLFFLKRKQNLAKPVFLHNFLVRTSFCSLLSSPNRDHPKLLATHPPKSFNQGSPHTPVCRWSGRGNLKTQPRCSRYTQAPKILAKESAPLVAVPDLKVQPTSRIAHIREKVPSCTLPPKPAPQSSRAHSPAQEPDCGNEARAASPPVQQRRRRAAPLPARELLLARRAPGRVDPRRPGSAGCPAVRPGSRESKDGPWKFSDCRKRSRSMARDCRDQRPVGCQPLSGAHNFRPWSRRC